MAAFDVEGFLSDVAEAEGLREARARFPAELQLFDEVNRALVRVQFDLVVPHESRHVAAAALFFRFISNAQATVVLGMRGMDRQMVIMLRVTLESLFNLRAVVKSEGFFHRYAAAEHVGKLALAKALQRLGDTAAVSHARVSELVTVLKERVGELDAAKIEVREVAQAAEMLDWYCSLYVLGNTPVHTNSGEMGHHLVLNDQGELTALRNERSWDQLGFILLTLVELMSLGLASVTEMFGLEALASAESWTDRVVALMPRHGTH